MRKGRERSRGVGLPEVLIGMLILVLASIATLSYYAFAKGGIGKQGNRRAALERARERLEQLMTANIDAIPIAQSDGQMYWLQCNGGTPCTWVKGGAGVVVTETTTVDDFPTQRMETTAQWRDDTSTGTAMNDVLEFSVKVWFVPVSTNAAVVVPDDGLNRVYLKTVRIS